MNVYLLSITFNFYILVNILDDKFFREQSSLNNRMDSIDRTNEY